MLETVIGFGARVWRKWVQGKLYLIFFDLCCKLELCSVVVKGSEYACRSDEVVA
jgi:hypothetical protein